MTDGPSRKLTIKRRHAGRAGAERDVAEQIEQDELVGERPENVVEHQPAPAVTVAARDPAASIASTTRFMPLPGCP